jgi:hypothetical protein
MYIKDVTTGRITKAADPVGVLDDPHVAWVEEMIQYFFVVFDCHSFVNLQYLDENHSFSPATVSLATAFLPAFPPAQGGYIVSLTNCGWLPIQPTIQGVNQIRSQARSHLASQESQGRPHNRHDLSP